MKQIIHKLLYISLITFFLIILKHTTVQAATATLSASTNEPTEGQNVTVTANVSAGAWNLQFSGAGKNETIYGYTQSNANASDSKTISFTAGTAGTKYTFTLIGDMTDISAENSESVNKSITITVKAKETTPETPSEPQTPTEPEKPKELQFSKVNETVYVEKTVNLRASYSSSSKLIATIDVGESLNRIGKYIGTADGYNWSKILYNGQEVYAISRNLTTEKPETTEEPVEENPDEEQPTEETPTEETPVEEQPTEEVPVDVFGLSKLEIKNYTLSPKFDTETYEYTIGLKEDISTLEINAVANNENATVEIIGNENLINGENVITILVTNAETEEVATYQIIVNKNVQEDTEIKANWFKPSTWGTREKIIVGIIGALIFVIIILIIVKIRLAKKEDDDLDLPGADELDRALTEHQELAEDEEIKEKEEEEKSKTDIEKAQEYFEQYSKRRGKHF